MANHCTLSRDDFGNYKISSGDFFEETWTFTDPPHQLEAILDTHNFFQSFEQTFSDEGDGLSPPNAAVTLVDEDAATINGPKVAVLMKSVAIDTTGPDPVFAYEIEQSADQAAILPLDQFFPGIQRKNELAFLDCSFFIDTVWIVAIVAAAIVMLGFEALIALLGSLGIIVTGTAVICNESEASCQKAIEAASKFGTDSTQALQNIVKAIAPTIPDILDKIKVFK